MRPVRADAPRFTRRHVLATAALVSGAAVAGLGLEAARIWDQDAAAGFSVLSDAEAAIVEALAEAIFPPGGTPPQSGREVGASQWFDRIVAAQPSPTGELLRAVLHLLDRWSQVAEGLPFAELPLDRRIERLRGWTHHRRHEVSAVVGAVILFVANAYCGHPAIRSQMPWAYTCGYER